MDILSELSKSELRKRAVEELIEAQNKIINDCVDRYNFYKVELEKIDILENLIQGALDTGDQRKRYSCEIESALEEGRQAVELKTKLQNLK